MSLRAVWRMDGQKPKTNLSLQIYELIILKAGQRMDGQQLDKCLLGMSK